MDLISALSPEGRLKLYVILTRDYYLINFRNTGFKYFDAGKYLAANEDVRLDALRYSPEDIYAYALKHYLEHGIFEGRSSGTDVDPMLEILVKPEILSEIILSSDKPVPDVLYEAFVRATGKPTTTLDTSSGDKNDVDPSNINDEYTVSAASDYTNIQGGDSDNSGGDIPSWPEEEYR